MGGKGQQQSYGAPNSFADKWAARAQEGTGEGTADAHGRSSSGEGGPRGLAQALSAMGYGALGAMGGPFTGVGMGAYGFNRGGSKFDDKAAKELGVTKSDYALGVKHGVISKSTGSLLDNDDDDDDGGLGGWGSDQDGFDDSDEGWL